MGNKRRKRKFSFMEKMKEKIFRSPPKTSGDKTTDDEKIDTEYVNNKFSYSQDPYHMKQTKVLDPFDNIGQPAASGQDDNGRDFITGCFNRAGLEKYLNEISSDVYCLAFCDMDDFKMVNDTYGHAAGDEILRSFGTFMKNNMRKNDRVFRYGGDEFVLALPNTDINSAKAFLDRVHSSWVQKKFSAIDNQTIAFSIGIAQYGIHGETSSEVLKAADGAMYAAKKDGSGIVTAHSNDTFSYNTGPYQQEGHHLIALKTLESNDVQINTQTPTQKAVHNISSKTKIIVICSPWVSSGVSVFTVAITRALSMQNCKVAVIDCDLSGRGLGVRLNIKDSHSDWRHNSPPVMLPSGVTFYPLSPAIDIRATESDMENAIAQASIGADWLVIDVGTNPDAYWFKCATKWAGLVLWVIKSDPLMIAQASLQWTNRPQVQCREILILNGPGDLRLLEGTFMLPGLQVKDMENQKTMKKIVDNIVSLPIKNGMRIMAVGFKEVPEAPGIIFDHFKGLNEAISWLRFNKPNVVLVSEDVKETGLLEYDAGKHGIPFFRLSEGEVAEFCAARASDSGNASLDPRFN